MHPQQHSVGEANINTCVLNIKNENTMAWMRLIFDNFHSFMHNEFIERKLHGYRYMTSINKSMTNAFVN